MTTNTDSQTHEFVEAHPAVHWNLRLCCKAVGGGLCKQPRDAAIHRVNEPPPKCMKCGHEARSYGTVRYATCHTIGNRLCDCVCSFVSDTPAEREATVDEIMQLSLCQNGECAFNREQLQLARELLEVAFAYSKFGSTIKEQKLRRRIQDFLIVRRERTHADYCGLAADHEGDCVAVVSKAEVHPAQPVPPEPLDDPLDFSGSDLSACPFCGSVRVEERGAAMVHCYDCGARAPKAIWNTRAHASEVAELRRRDALSRQTGCWCDEHGHPCKACEYKQQAREALLQTRTLLSTLKHRTECDPASLDVAIELTAKKVDAALGEGT